MEFKELYKNEMKEIRHNPELDRSIIDYAEQKMKRKRKIILSKQWRLQQFSQLLLV